MTNEQIGKALPIFTEIREKKLLITQLRKAGTILENLGGVTVRFYRKDIGEIKCERLTPGLVRALIAAIIDNENETLGRLNKEFEEI